LHAKSLSRRLLVDPASSRDPVVTQGDNPNNRIELLQSRLAQHGSTILDVGGAADCFFKVVYHQLYGEPSYHMNIRSIGVK